MSKLIKGKNMVAQVEIDSVWYPVFCAKTVEFTNEQDEIETTTINSGISREYLPGMNNATMTCGGVAQMINDTKVGVVYLLQESIRRTMLSMRIYMTDDEGTVRQLTFNAFVRSLSISRERASYAQSSATFRISGAIGISTPIAPPTPPSCEVQDTLYLELAEGATSVQDNDLIEGVDETITILSVSRAGTTHYETTGTPGSLEFSYDETTGTITFDSTNPGNSGGEEISIEWKIEV